MNYNSLRTAIAAAIKSPADPKISGSILQQQLIGIVNALDLGSLYLGKAETNTVPNAEANGFYFALNEGTYTNFVTNRSTSITVNKGEIAILVRSGNAWAKETIDVGAAVIDDDIESEDKTWSSNKINQTKRLADSLGNAVFGSGVAADVDKAITSFGPYDTSGGVPPRTSNDNSKVFFFRRYIVDLNGAYDSGVRSVEFYGLKYTAVSDICAGVTVTGLSGNNASDGLHAFLEGEVEAYVKSEKYSENNTAGWYTLPVTKDTKYLVGCLCTINMIGTPTADHYAGKGVDLSYVPTKVILHFEAKDGLVTDVENLEERVTDLENSGVGGSLPLTYLPRKIYGIIGETMQVFTRSVVRAWDPYRYYTQFVCKKGELNGGPGRVTRRYYEVTPELVSGSIPGNLNLEMKVANDNYDTTEAKIAQLVLTQQSALGVPGGGINVLCVGASTTAAGEWPSEMFRRLTGTGGTPAGFGLSGIRFVGRKTGNSVHANPNVHFEATGGWRWRDFYTPKDAIRFTVSGNPSVGIGSVYRFVDANDDIRDIRIQEVNVGGDERDNIMGTFNSGSAELPATGQTTLEKVSGSGSDTITFSAAELETYAPFYDTENNKISFVPYVDEYCDSKIDVVIFALGSTNYEIGWNTDLTRALTDMKTLLDVLHDEYPNCKIIIGTAPLPSPYYGFEEDYGAGSPSYSSWSRIIGLFRYTQAVEDFIYTQKDPNDDDYTGYITFADLVTQIDSEYVYPVTTKEVNTRMPNVKEVTGTNGAHPMLEGYYQYADIFTRVFSNAVLTSNE